MQVDFQSKMAEHDERLKEHDKRINSLEVKEAVLGTKLDLTNKLLGGILLILATAVVGILFDMLKQGII